MWRRRWHVHANQSTKEDGEFSVYSKNVENKVELSPLNPTGNAASRGISGAITARGKYHK